MGRWEGQVTWTSSRGVGAFAIVGAVAVAAISAQGTNQARDFDEEIRTAVASAKQAAGFEWQGALVRVCLQPPQIAAENTSDNLPGYIAKPASVPARNTWYAEPAKVFDDFYFVGGKIHSAWALTTSEGIILFDTIFPYNSEELIVGGLKKLGLDPTMIKYIVVTHGHGDHIGGA
jgi:metallo-beta-lactamase class B